MQFLDKTGLAHVWDKIVAKFVPVTRTINGKALNANITLAAADVSAVPTTRKINNKALSADITLSATDVSAVPTTRTINGKALSSNITLSASDVNARSNTWVPALTDCSGTLTIAKGGTGATDAATALTNLGAVASTNGSVDTTLSIQSASYPALYFKDSDDGKVKAAVLGTMSTNRVYIRSYATDTNYYENYYMPKADTGLTGNVDSYTIMTSKNIKYSSTQPTKVVAGDIWLRPV